MDKIKTDYWQDVQDKQLSKLDLAQEFPAGTFDSLESKKSRRDFLQIMGFSFSALPLASCLKIPVQKALPYLYKNDVVVPGVANWYATTCAGCSSSCSLTVKTREGRPIKIEGNELSPLTKGGVCALGQATVLSLYDSYRLKAPASWENLDGEVINHLKQLKNEGAKVALVTSTLKSPSTIALIDKFKEVYPNVEHIVFDPMANSALVQANKQTFGIANYSTYHFDKADFILSFAADFLGTWVDPVGHTKQYGLQRDLVRSAKMSQHIQVEAIMTLSGSNADERIVASSRDQKVLLLNILKRLQLDAGGEVDGELKDIPAYPDGHVDRLTAKLLEHKGKSLVVSGINDVSVQVIINSINFILKNYSKTVDLYVNPYLRYGEELKFEHFVSDLRRKKFKGIIFSDVNPLYEYYQRLELQALFKDIPLSVALTSSLDETSQKVKYVYPTSMFLESWNDTWVGDGLISVTQPVIQPLLGTRSMQDTLLTWMGAKEDFYQFMRTKWEELFFAKSSQSSFTPFWDKGLHDGLVILDGAETVDKSYLINLEHVNRDIANIKKEKVGSGITLALYEKVGMRRGKWANNPWLQELPDPITKVTWDNYCAVGPEWARVQGVKNGDVFNIKSSTISVDLPILIQPGMENNTVAIALGHGRTVSGKVGNNVGKSGYGFVQYRNGTYQFSLGGIKLTKKVGSIKLALTQTHHSMEGRPIVKETTYKEYNKNPASGNETHHRLFSMWSKHKKGNHAWAMVIDLNKCTGCSACIISCNAENNVPVVGRQEVLNRREMHWMRLDRYYKGDENNPSVVHQPIACQHCDNAPCETVCPVLATVQSSDGLNQQVYNRCVGTRYCANNCPYKVRRFNWFTYKHEDKRERMVLNPDVVVRSRGVMEKCSMCIQRIQEGKLKAKIAKRRVQDSDIKLACQQSCPGDAITFGDLLDPKSKIVALLQNSRNYRLLDELGIRPRVSFLTQVRNKE